MRTIVTMVVLSSVAWGQSREAAQAARKWRMGHEREILAEFIELLRMPNVARNVDDMRRNAAAIRTMYERRGVKTRLLEVEGAPPVVYGERLSPGATRTVVFYAHYDGQPVEPAMWRSGDAFRPVLEENGKAVDWERAATRNPEWRIVARSASDDKAPIIAFAAALDALAAAGMRPAVNWKFFFDGEEEAGSPHMEAVLAKYKDLLSGDLWLFCDGPVHQSRRQQVLFGVRGNSVLYLTAYGAVRELHSGHYGNWAPNPVRELTQLLASMFDESGKVQVRDFYKDVVPLGDVERRALADAPQLDAELRKELQLGGTEGDGRSLYELINLPALVIQGIAAAGVGEQTRNVIPDRARASLGIRVVAGTDWRVMQSRVIDHIRSQGWLVVDKEPDAATRMRSAKVMLVERRDGDNGVREPMDSEAGRRVLAAVEAARAPVVRMPTMGGTLPIAPIRDVMRVPVIVVPIANHDNSQHGHNENLRLQNLWDGIEVMAALLAM